MKYVLSLDIIESNVINITYMYILFQDGELIAEKKEHRDQCQRMFRLDFLFPKTLRFHHRVQLL